MKISERLCDLSTNDLIDELINRCEPAIFIGYKPDDVCGGNPMQTTFFHYKGDPKVCYGLCHQLSLEIQTNVLIEKSCEE